MDTVVSIEIRLDNSFLPVLSSTPPPQCQPKDKQMLCFYLFMNWRPITSACTWSKSVNKRMIKKMLIDAEYKLERMNLKGILKGEQWGRKKERMTWRIKNGVKGHLSNVIEKCRVIVCTVVLFFSAQVEAVIYLRAKQWHSVAHSFHQEGFI